MGNVRTEEKLDHLLDAERATKTTGMPDVAVARAAVMGLAREAVRAKRG